MLPDQMSVEMTLPDQMSVQMMLPDQMSVQMMLPDQMSIQGTPPQQMSIQTTLPDQLSVQMTLPAKMSIQTTLPDQMSVQATLPDQLTIQMTLPDQMSIQTTLPDQFTHRERAPSSHTIGCRVGPTASPYIEETNVLPLYETEQSSSPWPTTTKLTRHSWLLSSVLSLFLQQTKHESHILLCCHLVLLCFNIQWTVNHFFHLSRYLKQNTASKHGN